MNKFILGVLVTLVLTSCSSKFSFQKRRYNKGVYISQSSSNKLKTKATENAKNELGLNANIEKELKQEKVETKKVEYVKSESENIQLQDELVKADKEVNTIDSSAPKQKKSSTKRIKKDSYALQLDTKSEVEYEKKSRIPFANRSIASKNTPLGWGSDWGMFGIIGIGISALVALVYIFYLLFIVFALVDNLAAALVIIGIAVAIAIVFAIILLINSD